MMQKSLTIRHEKPERVLLEEEVERLIDLAEQAKTALSTRAQKNELAGLEITLSDFEKVMQGRYTPEVIIHAKRLGGFLDSKGRIEETTNDLYMQTVGLMRYLTKTFPKEEISGIKDPAYPLTYSIETKQGICEETGIRYQICDLDIKNGKTELNLHYEYTKPETGWQQFLGRFVNKYRTRETIRVGTKRDSNLNAGTIPELRYAIRKGIEEKSTSQQSMYATIIAALDGLIPAIKAYLINEGKSLDVIEPEQIIGRIVDAQIEEKQKQLERLSGLVEEKRTALAEQYTIKAWDGNLSRDATVIDNFCKQIYTTALQLMNAGVRFCGKPSGKRPYEGFEVDNYREIVNGNKVLIRRVMITGGIGEKGISVNLKQYSGEGMDVDLHVNPDGLERIIANDGIIHKGMNSYRDQQLNSTEELVKVAYESAYPTLNQTGEERIKPEAYLFGLKTIAKCLRDQVARIKEQHESAVKPTFDDLNELT